MVLIFAGEGQDPGGTCGPGTMAAAIWEDELCHYFSLSEMITIPPPGRPLDGLCFFKAPLRTDSPRALWSYLVLWLMPVLQFLTAHAAHCLIHLNVDTDTW